MYRGRTRDTELSLCVRLQAANNGIASLVEIGRSPERFHRDVVFLDLSGGAFKVLRTNVSQHPRQIGGAGEYAGRQDGIQLMPFLPKVGGRLHW